MGSSASRATATNGHNSCGCLQQNRSRKWARKTDNLERNESFENRNQNRNQSQHLTHQPDLHNNNASDHSGLLDFKVVKIKTIIDKRLTTIDEKSSAVLKYRTPHFRALATVEVPPLSNKQAFQIGWIQTCVNMRFTNRYGSEGVTSWEFPEIVTGKYKMISDADGKMYPWYGAKHEVQTVQGPTASSQAVTVHMNDNFFPQVTWYIPFSAYDRSPRLSHIHRKQKFFTFLVARNIERDEFHILRTISWCMELNISVDCRNPLGRRARLEGPYEQEPPVVYPDNSVELYHYAMKPPNANNSQALLWRPKHGDAHVIVPPVETTMDLGRYVRNARNYKMHTSDCMAMHDPEL